MTLLRDDYKSKLIKRAILYVGICIVAFGFFGVAIAAEPVGLTEMVYLANEDVDAGISTMTVYGFLSADANLPVTTHFFAPSGFALEVISGLAYEEDEREVEVPYTSVDAGNGFTRFDVVLNEGFIFMASFSRDARIFDATATGDSASALIAGLEIVSPGDLDFLTVGFVSPNRDYVGTGENIVQLGTDADGNGIFGTEYANVPEGEILTTTVTFDYPSNEEEIEAPEAVLDATSASSQWYGQPLVWIVAALSLLVVCLSVFVYFRLIPKRSRIENGDEE